jgi:penicillin amidase
LRQRIAIDFGSLAEAIPASFNLFGLGDGISWNYCGDVPIRSSKLDPRLPFPGTGEYDWAGIVPKSQMPRQTNPRTGIIVNWNNKPVRWWPNYDTPIWGEIFRNTSILKRIPAQGKITPTDIEGVVRAIALEDSDAAELIPVIASYPVKGLEGLDSTLYQTIISWDGMRLEGTLAPVVYTPFYDSLRRELFEPKLGLMLNPSVFFLATQASLTRKALARETAIDYLDGRSPSEVIAAAVKRAAEALKNSLGEDTSKWAYRDAGISWPGLRRVLHSDRGTYIQLVVKEPAGLTGRYIAPPGVSENKESAHYADQVAKAATWSMLPMEFQKRN